MWIVHIPIKKQTIAWMYSSWGMGISHRPSVLSIPGSHPPATRNHQWLQSKKLKFFELQVWSLNNTSVCLDLALKIASMITSCKTSLNPNRLEAGGLQEDHQISNLSIVTYHVSCLIRIRPWSHLSDVDETWETLPTFKHETPISKKTEVSKRN